MAAAGGACGQLRQHHGRPQALPRVAPGAQPEASQQLLAQTTELLALDGLIEGGLSFQGVADLSRTVQLCAKGGVAWRR